jgi:putative nucleotidyltransferase with HDIG domain
VLAQIESLPSLATVVGEFLQLSKQKYFTATDFENILIKDQALVARLLKVANSSFFGCPRPIETVHEAIVLMGMDNMKNIVYAVSSSGLLRKNMKCYNYPDKGYWLHSTAVAIAAGAIVDQVGCKDLGGEEGFVAGLLHDIGKLILDDFMDPEPGLRAIDLTEERETSGFDHVELGVKILERWKISEGVTEALRFHHDFKADGQPHVGGAIVQVADRLCNAWNIGTGPVMDLGADIDLAEYEEALAVLGFSEENFNVLLRGLRKKLENIEDFYTGDE